MDAKQETLNESSLLELLSVGGTGGACRCCLVVASHAHLYNIHDTYINDENTSVSSILKIILQDVDPNEKYLDMVCSACLSEIINIYNFKLKCMTSVERLKDLYSKIYQNIANMSLTSNDNNQDSILIVIPEDTNNEKENSPDRKLEKSKLKDVNTLLKLSFVCKICSEHFESTELLQNHFTATHNVQNFEEYCKPKLFTRKDSVKCKQSYCIHCGNKQLNGFHENAQIFSCGECEQVYPCQGLLLNHIDNIHSDDKFSRELTTNKNAKRKAVTTVESQERDSLNCNVCRRTYHTIAGLRKHMSSHYNLFICDYCDMKYTLKDNLRRHILTKHTKLLNFFCKLCHKGFLYIQDYKTHQNVHTKERRYQCHLCGKKFVAKKTLINHMRLHSGEKPYSCSSCNDKFVSATRLKEHVQLKHIGKLKCPKCNKEFTRKESITKHLKLQRCNPSGE